MAFVRAVLGLECCHGGRCGNGPAPWAAEWTRPCTPSAPPPVPVAARDGGRPLLRDVTARRGTMRGYRVTAQQ